MHSFCKKSCRAAELVPSHLRRGMFIVLYLAVLLLLSTLGASSYARSETRDISPATPRASTEILHNIFDGLAQGDFAKYSKDFAPDMKASQTREAFLTLQKRIQTALGKLKSLRYLGSYSQGGNVIELFKANFTKQKDDVLIKLVLDGKKPKPLVTGLWLDSPALEK